MAGPKGDAHPPKPKLTKAERRALQEAQRAAKAENKSHGGGKKLQFDDPKRVAKHVKKEILHRTPVQKDKGVDLFQHLPQYENMTSMTFAVGFGASDIHSAVLAAGIKMSSGEVRAPNVRCVMMLKAFKEFISDYVSSEDQALSRELELALRPQYRFLLDCRPPSISMSNALTYLKLQITKLDPEWSDKQAKTVLLESIDKFMTERIEYPDHIIASFGNDHISNGDVVMIYQWSRLEEMVILSAANAGKSFRVIVVDSRPHFSGRKVLDTLLNNGIYCTYVLINAASSVISSVTKVFLGAAGLMTNGSAISPSGSAMIAHLAQLHNVPVIMCCETFKFYHRAHVDAITVS